MTARVLVCFLALIVAGPSAAAKKVDVSGSEASSTYPDENNISYDAGRTSDGKLSTAWVEGSAALAAVRVAVLAGSRAGHADQEQHRAAARHPPWRRCRRGDRS